MTLGNKTIKTAALISFLFLAEVASAQSLGSGNLSTMLMWLVAILILLALLFVGDSLLKLEAKNVGADKNGENYSILPNFKEIFRPKVPDFVPSENLHTLSKGYDLKLEGKASSIIDVHNTATTFAVKPPDFRGIAPIPKMLVQIGDSVKAGDPLFFNKKTPEIKFCSPVSGEVIAINRAEKRAISEVIILADKEQTYREFGQFDLTQMNREELVGFLAESGVWPMIRRRPYQLIPALTEVPRDIFISTFDTAPLAPDSNLFVEGREAEFQKGLDVLAKLTDGKVFLGLNGKSQPAAAYANATGVEKHYFHGKHPAGNVGVQIHHAKPIANTDAVWTLGVQEVISIGALFTKGRFETDRIIAIAGAELSNPRHIKTKLGASIENFVKQGLNDDAGEVRYISGDALSGTQIEANSFIGFFDDQITVLQEGNYNEMFGWLLPLAPRPSVSRTMPGFLMPNHEYRGDTNTHGEKRAFVVTGQYESVLPMDIFPQHLMKSILIGDIEKMEGLGILELAEEDIAICEFVCTSKQPLQAILKDGLDMMLEQG